MGYRQVILYGVFKVVTQNADIWMVTKQDLPKMNKLWIEGTLEVEWDDPALIVTLSATHIIIMVGLITLCDNSSLTSLRFKHIYINKGACLFDLWDLGTNAETVIMGATSWFYNRFRKYSLFFPAMAL